MNDPALGALRAAVAAQLILWHTQAELAEALGFDHFEVPETIDEMIRNEVSSLASCAPDRPPRHQLHRLGSRPGAES